MATLRDLKKAAAKVGATVRQERQGDSMVCYVEAPKGYHWNDGVHEFVDIVFLPWKPDYDDLISRISYGLEKCEDGSCQLWVEGECEWWSSGD